MNVDRGTPSRSTSYAQFDASGGFLHGNAGLLGTAGSHPVRPGTPAELVLQPFLDSLELIEGIKDSDDADIADLIATWGERSEAFRAKDEDGEWHLLSSYISPDGGRCYLDINIPAPENKTPSTTLTGSDVEGDCKLQMLSVAVQSLSEGIAVFDENHRLVVFNERYREMNPQIADFIRQGVHWETLVREETRRGVLNVTPDELNIWISKLLSFGIKPERIEMEFTDGWLSIVADPIDVGGFVVTLSDITKRKRAEATAREADQMLSKVLEACPANVMMSRISDGDVIYRSPASDELFGPPKAAHTHFDDPQDRADYITELLPTGRLDDFPVYCRTGDGRRFPALVSARIIEYKGEEVIVSSTTDLTEQTRARDELRELNQRLRDAIESLSEGFALFDANEKLVVANERFLDLNAAYADQIKPGVSNEALLVAAVEHDHFVNAEEWLADYRAERERGETLTRREYEFQLSDGTWITALRNPTREGGLVLSWLDVTEQKNAEEKLQESNDRLRDAIESLNDGFALYDSDERLVLFNKRYVEQSPYMAHAILPGASYADIMNAGIQSGKIIEEDEDFLRNSRSGVGADNLDERHELRLKDGSVFVVSLDSTSDGGFVITRRDVTKQRRAEEAQREFDAMMRRLLETCPAILVMRRFDSREVIYRSELSVETFGSFSNSSDFWTDRADELRVAELLRKEGRVDNLEVVMNRIGRDPIPVAFSSRVFDFNGEQMVVSHAYDLSERVAMEKELTQQRESLHQSEKLSALGELLAGVAHELNNPLSVVVGHALMLKEQAEDPELLRRAEKIGNAAERCARIVKAFLAMARQRPTELELTSVNTLLETAVDISSYGLQSAGAQVATSFAEGLPPVEVDSDQLIPVFTNLITNAEHAIADLGSKGRLTLSTAFDDSKRQVVIDISDNGPGVPEALRNRIFEPFFTTKEVGSGTGIGLAFCHRIIEAHGGTIRLLAGKGARFEIRLPAQAVVAVSDHVEIAHSKVQGQRALVIDDEPDVAELIENILRGDGYDVCIAASVEEALELLPGDFTIILSDMNLPGLKGSDLFKVIAERWPDIKPRLGFITGDTMSSGSNDFLRESGRPYLEKPVTPDELRQFARALVESRETG